jgi:predicted nucleotidyltransferase
MQKNIEKVLGEGLERLLQKIRLDTNVCAVFLFGSVAKGVSNSLSDIDICIVLNNRLDSLAMSHKKLEYLGLADYDVTLFQQLPLYIRHRVIKEGKVLFCRDEGKLYELVIETIKEFEDFKPIYYEYLEGVIHAR